MNIVRNFRPLASRSFSQSLVRKFRIYTSNNEAKEATQPQVQEEKYDFEDIKVLERTVTKKPQIEPFIKNIFLSKYDRELLAYPEILSKEDREDLDERVSRLEKTFSDPEKSENDRINSLKSTKMFSAPEKLTNNGLAMLVTERLRYLEIIAGDTKLAKELSEHWICLEAIRKGLHPEEYEKLMPELIGGENTVNLCIKETMAERTSQNDFRTTAELDGSGIWRVTGEKECIKPEGFRIVLAKLEAERLRAFLVKPQAEGVMKKEKVISFNSTPALPLDLITEQDLSQIFGLLRLDTAVLCYSAVKAAIMASIQHVRGKFVGGKPMADLITVRKRVADALITLYAAESATYFTAGLVDGYENPDVDVEMACCKNYIIQNGIDALLSLLKIPGMHHDRKFESLLSDFQCIANLDENEDMTNQFIALNGIHHFGKNASEEIKQLRNPLHFPSFFFKKLIANRKQENDNPVLNLNLNHHLHPTLTSPAQNLEYCVLRMRYATENLLARHGLETATAYIDLERLSHAVTDIYVQSAVLARASRSYCIGLRNAEIEMKLAATIVETSKERVRTTIAELINGEYLNCDFIKNNLGQKVLDTSGLLVEKPIERTFW